MGKEQELPLDPAYTDGPYSVIPMPINAHGTGPEMDPAKVQITLYEVWNGHCLSLGQWPSRALAQFVADALNRRSSDEQAEVVGIEVTGEGRGGGLQTITVWDHENDEQGILFVRYRPPSVAKGGVTEDMVERALDTYADSLPELLRDQCRRAPEMRVVLRRALTAALAVGDDRIREGWQTIHTAKKDRTIILGAWPLDTAGKLWVRLPVFWDGDAWVAPWDVTGPHPVQLWCDLPALPTPPSRGEGV